MQSQQENKKHKTNHKNKQANPTSKNKKPTTKNQQQTKTANQAKTKQPKEHQEVGSLPAMRFMHDDIVLDTEATRFCFDIHVSRDVVVDN